MSELQKGTCHCGKIEISFPKKASFSFACHCHTCQKLVSGGRLLGLGVGADDFSVNGAVADYSYAGGSGKNITLSFCPTCSTQLFARPDAIENTIVVRSNALEHPNVFKPDQTLFLESACDWDQEAFADS